MSASSEEGNKLKESLNFLKSLIVTEEQKGKMGAGKEKINLFINLLNLMDIFLNDSSKYGNKIEKNGIEQGLDNLMVLPLKTLFLCKFDGLAKLKAINQDLKGSEVLEQISKTMKIKEDVILGLIEMIVNIKGSKDVSTFINYVTSLNKVILNNSELSI